MRVNRGPLLVLLLAVVVVVGGLVTGDLGTWILGGLLFSVVLFIAAAILSGFVTEIGKIFRR